MSTTPGQVSEHPDEKHVRAIAKAISDSAFMYGWESLSQAEQGAWMGRARRAWEFVIEPQLRDLRERLAKFEEGLRAPVIISASKAVVHRDELTRLARLLESARSVVGDMRGEDDQ